MAKQAQIVFLEDWLRNTSDDSSSSSIRPSQSSSARAIIQAWAELRDSLQKQDFLPKHLQSLQTLFNSQATLYVADPQAKLLISILSSPHLSPPPESYPLFLRLLYIWVRKSSKPSSSLVESVVPILSRFLSTQSEYKKSAAAVCEAVLLLGAISWVPVLSNSSRRACSDMLCGLLEEEHRAIGLCEELVADILAGIGYALVSSESVYLSRILGNLLGIWCKEGGPCGCVTYGLMIMHLIEWVLSTLINSRSVGSIGYLVSEIAKTGSPNYAPFAVLMAASGVLRALNRTVSSGNRPEINPQLRNSVEDCIEYIARDLTSKTEGFGDSKSRLLLQCISLGLARCGPVSSRTPLLTCLTLALLNEVFPLQSFYTRAIGNPQTITSGLSLDEVKEQLSSVLFRESGAITGAFCNQYASADEENKRVVENLIWKYCQDIYSGHRLVVLMLRGVQEELLRELEKIAEAAFLMVVVFAAVVTKQRLNSKCSRETQVEISVRILISFSCMEYFRHVRFPEYTDAIQAVALIIQENESACVLYVESMPSYAELTNQLGLLCFEKIQYIWSKDDVQTARMLFYMRVIPTCIERLPGPVFRKMVASTMFLYMGHPSGKVARASHSVFVAFMSSGRDSNLDDKVQLKEQLVFYYVQRALEAYPGITPFEGMASGIAAVVRHLPAGSPAIFYCIHCIFEKANTLCSEAISKDADLWKNWQGDSEPSKKLVELLIRLISLVDIQVLPTLMKLLAQLIMEFPKDGQNLVLDEIYSLVAESDDVTRKPTLVSWLQSLSYLCSQPTDVQATSKVGRIEEDIRTETVSANRLSARL